jgi:nucleotide-binding universal stress UspA family protein
MTNVLSASATGPAAGEDPGVALRHLLWACDFSECSSGALRLAIPLARAFGSDITALHVMPTTFPPGAGAASLTNPNLLQPHLHHDVSEALGRYLGPAVGASLSTRIALREGKPVDEILALAASLPADLIVLGTHGTRAITHAVLGSVAEGVLGRARCPVLTVPTASSPEAGTRLETILLATDFSAHAAEAQRFALSIGARNHARLLLMHVVEGDTLMPDAGRVRAAEERLGEAMQACGAAGCPAEAIVILGSASRELARVARERAVDLIVMGVEGPHAVHRMFFGSTTHRVVRDAPCAVLAVRRS